MRAPAQAEYPALFGFSVSHTTRAPRPGELDGTHYHFTDRDAFLAGVAEGACRAAGPEALPELTVACALSRLTGKFLEHAHVHGNIYGTSFEAVQRVTGADKVCILDVDVQGAEAVKRTQLGAAFVFISPPSMEELERRLRGRGTETEEKARAPATQRAQGLADGG